MASRIALLLITLFWLLMNALLWNSEFGSRDHIGGTVPLAVVWQKILTAPDNSLLEMTHHGQRAGYCRWAAIVGQDAANLKPAAANTRPDGIVEELPNYRIDFEGNLLLNEAASRLHFDLSVRFDTNQAWQELKLQVGLRPANWEVHSLAREQTVHLFMEDDEGKSERVFTMADLQNPEALARAFALPLPLAAMVPASLPRDRQQPALALSLGLKWEARDDWITFGHTAVRVYRLQAHLLDHYQVVIIVSRVGEILRVELPDDLVMVNDRLIF
ncbi:MAG: hypothetical protein JWR19_1054 [Pedosphaera sp.]|nr:hypothetical protein [Pedosphaera sp.]